MLRVMISRCKKLISIMLLVTLMLSICGCSEKYDVEKYDVEKYHNSDWGVSISYPIQWFIQDTSAYDLLNVMFSKEEYNIGKDNEAVISFVGKKGDSGIEFVNEVEEDIKSGKQIIDEKDITLNKIEAKMIVINGAKDNSKDMVIYYVFIKQGENNCVIMYNAKENNKENLKIIENMLITLTFD